MPYAIDGKDYVRWVLADWYEGGAYLEATPGAVRSVSVA